MGLFIGDHFGQQDNPNPKIRAQVATIHKWLPGLDADTITRIMPWMDTTVLGIGCFAMLVMTGTVTGSGDGDDWQSLCGLNVQGNPGQREFLLQTKASLRDHQPEDGKRIVREDKNQPWIEAGGGWLDALYALALREAEENAVQRIEDKDYADGKPFPLEAFETGRLWHYVWTRDISYAADLGLARLDPERTGNSLFFKTSPLKKSVSGKHSSQMLQDTGTGGSYPVSTDRVALALGLRRLALESTESPQIVTQAYPILRDTLLQDRGLVLDPSDGLYRGETSFLDWREQTYPPWTARDTLAIGMSKALSTNLLHYSALRTAEQWARSLGKPEEAGRWESWANELQSAIRQKFFAGKNVPSAFLLAGETSSIPVRRRDLLAESLAIELGLVPTGKAKEMLASYPVGPFGPSVVWPHEKSVPIYHNLAIWPFVTAYYVKASRTAGYEAGVECGFRSLIRGAAMNLSNMENLDWAHGLAEAEYHGLHGPVINSQRQLWSVAGFVSAIEDVLFGLRLDREGITVTPCIPPGIRKEFFPGASQISLRNLKVQGRRHDLFLELPPGSPGAVSVASVRLNGRAINPRRPVPAKELLKTNEWRIKLAPAENTPVEKLNLVQPDADPGHIFGPSTPEWKGAGITVRDGHAELSFICASEVDFEIYRDGKLVAGGLRSNTWVDPEPVGTSGPAPEYAVAAVDRKSGNQSHLSTFRRALTEADFLHIPLSANEEPVALHVPAGGTWVLKALYANGAGEIGTGITCGIRLVEILDTKGRILHRGHMIFPQTGADDEFRPSSSVSFHLAQGDYRVRLSEDEFSRNMSFFAGNERATGFPGGGQKPHNKLNLRELILSR